MRSATESGEQNVRGQAVASPEIPVEQIRAALDKLLASPGFVNADRLTRFLRYVVDTTLEGQTDKLKETMLGIEVFGRKPTYDPRIDAVVRTEAVKLRARIKEYYETEGREDRVCIDMPKGGYVPVFRLREEPVETAPADVASFIAEPNRLNREKIAIGLLIALILAGSVWFAVRKSGRAGRSADLSSIAVLPFEDLSPQHDQEYFCDGMTEEIIDALTKLDGFRVVARTSSFAFKGKQQDIREIGKKLNVGAVLEGSVRKFGNKLRVTAQLNSVADGYHLWSDTYERELPDVFSVQDEISHAIVNTLQVKLGSQRSTVRPKPENLETYDLYLKGRYHWSRWRTEGAEKAQHYFEQAIARDPSYAPAYAGLADSYCWLGFFSALRPTEAMPKARAAALKAIQLDDSLAAAHVSMGYVKALYDFDLTGAEREFRRAIELNPGLSDGHFGYGIAYLAPFKKLPEAIREMKIARDLDPLSLAANTYLGLTYQMYGKDDQAILYYKKALELDPGFFEAHMCLAEVYTHKRMFKEFYEELDKARGEGISSRIELIRGLGQALQGKSAEALATVRPWERPANGVYVRPTAIANVYAVLGQREQSIRWLEKAYQERDGMLMFTNTDSLYKPYWSDPRFADLMQKIGMP